MLIAKRGTKLFPEAARGLDQLRIIIDHA